MAANPKEDYLYGPEYDALAQVLAMPSVRGAFVAYLKARRSGAAETMLNPIVDATQLQIIRGKAQMIAELLCVCDAALALADREETEPEGDEE